MNKEQAATRIKDMLDEIYLDKDKFLKWSHEYYEEFADILGPMNLSLVEFKADFPGVSDRIMESFESKKEVPKPAPKPAVKTVKKRISKWRK